MKAEWQAEAIIGDEAKRFKESDLGRTVLGMAEQEKQAAYEELALVNPSEPEAVRQLQNVVWRVDSFKGWLNELITKGENAIVLLKAEAENE